MGGPPGLPPDLLCAWDEALARLAADADKDAAQPSCELLSVTSDEHGHARVVAAASLARGTSLCLPHARTFCRAELAACEDTPDLWTRVELVHCDSQDADATWAVPHTLVSTLRFCFDPGAASAVVATPSRAGCVVITLRELQAGEEIVRQAAAGLTRSVSRAAAALGLLSRHRWADDDEYTSLECAVTAAMAAAPPVPTPRLRGSEGCPADMPEIPVPSVPVRIYTDYALIAEQLAHDARFDVADAPKELDMLWLMRPLSDFSQLPPGLLVNQFPYEGCLVRKDLCSPVTARLAPSAANSASGFPAWCPPTFDLATQSHLWRATHRADTTWIVKRASGTHSSDCCITRLPACVLRYAIATDCDRVAQQYIEHPALLPWHEAGIDADGPPSLRKFDVRVYVAVRQFWPRLDAVLDTRFYGRVASSTYSAHPDTHGARAVHLTVTWYGQQQHTSAPATPLLLPAHDLQRLVAQLAGSWSDVQTSLAAALHELFETAGRCFVGRAQNSRALYGCDIMFTPSWQPQVLEVNFCGDLSTLLHRVPGGCPGFVGDTLSFLCLGDVCEHHVRL